jgi:tetratricopeptide (TPR) repeat protein
VGALRRPDLPLGPARELNDALHALHHRAGWPSLRTLARQVGCSHTTVSKAFSSPKLPAWGVLELLVEALDGDTAVFHDLWLSATGATHDTTPVPRIAGRRSELDAVRRHLAAGAGLLLVTGEAGMGKSKLVETATGLIDQEVFVATGSCLPLSTEAPLLPMVDLLRAIYEADGGQWLEKALADCASYVPAAVSRLLPELAVPTDNNAEVDAYASERLFAAVGATLKALALHRPVCLVIEDLHWADASTLDLLEHLLARGTGVAIVGTYRLDDPDTAPTNEQWRGRVTRLSHVEMLELRPLSLDDTAEQLALLLGRAADPSLAVRIHGRAQGHPLFAEQLCAHDEPDQPLPRLLGELLDQRLDRVSESALTVAMALAVADRGLTEGQLLPVTELSQARLTSAVRELARGRLLASMPTTRDVRLRHPLLAEAIRRRLVAGASAAAHRRIAAVLSEASDCSPAEVAAHWREAHQPAEELCWRVRAAREAHARFAAHHEAREWARALELWSGNDPVDGVSLSEALIAALDVQEMIGETLIDGLVERALALAERVHGREAAALYQRAAVVRGATNRGVNSEAALPLLARAIAIHETLPPCSDHLEALWRRSYLLKVRGHYDEAAATLEGAVEMAKRIGDRALIREALAGQGWEMARSGNLEGGLAMIEQAHRTVLPRPDPVGEVELAIMHTDVLLMAEARAEQVVAVGSHALAVAHEWDLEIARLGTLRANMAQAFRQSGQLERALEFVSDASFRPGPATAHQHMEWACLMALRGAGAEAAKAFAELENLSFERYQLPLAESTATAMLWYSDAGPILARLEAAIESRVETQASGELGTTFALAARAAADASVKKTRGSRAVPPSEVTAALVTLLGRSVVDPFSPHPCKAAATAHASTWTAEIGRLTRVASVEHWVVAASEWDKLTRPHDAAYCRWRGAQVALQDGQGTLAARLLKRAATDSREHVPLTRAIAATAAGA